MMRMLILLFLIVVANGFGYEGYDQGNGNSYGYGGYGFQQQRQQEQQAFMNEEEAIMDEIARSVWAPCSTCGGGSGGGSGTSSSVGGPLRGFLRGHPKLVFYLKKANLLNGNSIANLRSGTLFTPSEQALQSVSNFLNTLNSGQLSSLLRAHIIPNQAIYIESLPLGQNVTNYSLNPNVQLTVGSVANSQTGMTNYWVQGQLKNYPTSSMARNIVSVDNPIQDPTHSENVLWYYNIISGLIDPNMVLSAS